MTTEHSTRRVIAAATVLALLALTGCASVAPAVPPAASTQAPTSATPAPLADDVPEQLAVPETLTCAIATDVPRSVIDERRPLSTLSTSWRAWIASEPTFTDPDGWFVLTESENEIAVAKREAPFDSSPWASVGFTGILAARDGMMAVGGNPGIDAATTCVFNLPLPDMLQTAYFVPKGSDDAAATSLTLLVQYMACQPGPTPESALQVTALRETADTIEIAVGADGAWWDEGGGDQASTCVGYPPTEFTVTLTAPVGDRKIIDAGVYPAVEVSAGATTNGG